MLKREKLEELKCHIKNLRDGLIDLERYAGEIADYIKEERFIPDDLSKSMIASLKNHGEEQKICKELYRSLNPRLAVTDIIPEFEHTVKNLHENLEKKKEILLQFNQLYSENCEVQKMLENEQEKLQHLLELVNADLDTWAITQPYVEFTETIRHRDALTAEEKLVRMEAMIPVFGAELSAHALVFQDIWYLKAEDGIIDRTSEPPLSVVVENVENQDSKKTENNSCSLLESFDYGKLICNKSPREEKKFGANAFKNDLNAFAYTKVEKKILEVLYSHGYITKDLFLAKNRYAKEDVVTAAFGYLSNRGYLRSYILDKYGELFCATKNCEKAFASKEARIFLGIKRSSDINKLNLSEESELSVAVKLMYAKIMENEYKNRNESIINVRLVMYPQSFFLKLWIQKKEEMTGASDLILGTSVYENDEILSLLEKENIGVNIAEVVERVIVAGMDVQQAHSVAVTIMETVLPIKKMDILLYALCEDKFYEFESFTAVSTEVVWPRMQQDKPKEIETALAEVNDRLPKKGESGNKETAWKEETAAAVELAGIEPKDSRDTALYMKPIVNKDEILANVYSMILKDRIYCATAYLKAYGNIADDMEQIWKKLAYAVNDPMERCSYSSEKLYDLFFDEDSAFHDYLLISAVLRTFFYNHVEYDYEMKSFYEGTIKENPVVNDCPELKSLIRNLMDFKDSQHKGIDVYADYGRKDSVLLEERLKEVKNEAKIFYDDKIFGKRTENASHKRFIETKKLIFSLGNDIPVYVKSIIDGEDDMIPLMKDFLYEKFIRDSSPIDIVNIDSSKIDDYIDVYWNKAGEKMRIAKKTSDLMGSFRQNLFNTLQKGISILCRWIICKERLNAVKMDGSFVQYKKIKPQLMEDIKKSYQYYKQELCEEDDSICAGKEVLKKTLKELEARLNGEYDEKIVKYFYINFLKSDLVVLDEEYMPVIEIKFQEVNKLAITERILEHSKQNLETLEERLRVIFEEYGDDFGSAKLIIDYLGESAVCLCEEKNYNLEESVNYGKRGAEKEKTQFVENLELMQSYGQIDNSTENKKEKILQIVLEAYNYALETNNFGFFKKVRESYEMQIREDAKAREKLLQKELDDYKQILNNTPAEKLRILKLDKVQKMLDVQNYTVAEDLLSRIKLDEVDVDMEILPKDYLAEFINKNDFYRERVSDISRPLSSVVPNRIRNKDDKGGKRLLENWPTSGIKLSAEKLRTLLQLLGFAVGEIKDQAKIGKIDNYIVTLEKPTNGRKVNYKHPIPEFGSRAVTEGIRVAFLFGKTDAARLIASIKEFGNAKNTIILLDYALPLAERRTLARKIKAEAIGKTFGILDRVMLMYLVDNYNEEYVNQMLMSIMLPFSYEQPYVWDSANVMPPEIFMGRNEELEKIESPSGVNIVYGGRQLGKTALLQRAKKDVDCDENGNRAVFVDIKGLDYKKAAKSIGRALSEDGVLENYEDTEDWETLAHLIKKRLKEEKNKIPYLLLLLDEADLFIESCECINYRPLDTLKDIQSIGVGRFKFVIAGLRNVVRFKREIALGNNSVITHLESMTVTPFKIMEARELLEVPLYYLGLRFPKDKDSLISLIFASANYFPGLIQLYCAKLIEAMRKRDYAGYNEGSTPIYEVQESHIKKVLSEEGFMQQIREKFEITLKLGGDNYYYIIALIIAHLYHENGYSSGYTARQVLDEGLIYEIPRIVNLKCEEVSALMEELCELNILRKNVSGEYLFNRYSFFQMMGSQQEVDDKLMEYMGE